jgi:DNA-binding NarL/FixJ family response regulator
VHGGDAVVAPSTTRRLVHAFAGRLPVRPTAPAQLAQLTDRERDVLGEVARGLSNTEIARKLVVSEATVKTHVGRILAKLGLRDRVQAVVYAYESGVVSPGQVDS